MGTISVSLPADGTGADVADYNTPITTIVNVINGNIDSNNLADGAVTAAKIADGAITPAKLTLGSCSYAANNGGTIQTNTTTSYVDVTSMSASITTNGGALSMSLSLPAYVSGAEFHGSLQINGVDYVLVDTNIAYAHGTDTGFLTLAAGVVPAGTYTVKARFKCTLGGNTATISSYNMRSFSVIEI